MSAVITPFEGTELFNTASFNNRISQINTGFSYVSNPNLLDNWYFGRPVNQKGGTEWLSSLSSAIPCVDRWNWWGQYVAGTRLNLLEDGLQITKPAEGQGQGLYQSIVQHIEKTRVPVGATVTLSALVKAEADASIVLALNSSYNVLSVQANVWELITYTFNAPSVEQTYDASIQRNSGGIAFIVKAAKLELGPTQTLAHQDSAGKWVLNEVPEYGEQLRRCRWYCKVYKAGEYLPCIAFALEDGWYCCAMLPYEMRAKPANNIGSNISVTLEPLLGGTGVETVLENYGTLDGVQILKFSKDGQAFKNASYYRIKLNADLILTADL